MIRLTGPEVRRFCNGMYTNNARDLRPGAGQRTAMLDDRGRLQGVFDLYCVSDTAFVAALEGVTAAAFEQRYGMYMMLDDIEFEVLDWQILTLQGGEKPVSEACIHPRDRSGLGGFDVVAPADILTAIAADAGLIEVDADHIEARRIRAGLPRWPIDMGAKRLPHEMGMRADFLHFDKGCYLGQETVNRVDVMGQVRRAFAGVRVSGDQPPPQGAAIVDAAGKKLGILTSPLVTSDLGIIALSVLKKPADKPGTPLIVTDGDRRWDATASALPFGSASGPRT